MAAFPEADQPLFRLRRSTQLMWVDLPFEFARGPFDFDKAKWSVIGRDGWSFRMNDWSCC